MDPPYQRRSVWNQEYKDFFVDSVLNNFPCHPIFLYEEMDANGGAKYSVVDGKQRLSSVFAFAEGEFPVPDVSLVESLRGKYFIDLPDDVKKAFWRYQFSIEYVDSTNEQLLKDIFDRINRNVAKLSPQELRHAKLDGNFIKAAEQLSESMTFLLPHQFPNIPDRYRRQMKDVEFVALLFLLIEYGPASYSQYDLDEAFLKRDVVWEEEDRVKETFQQTLHLIKSIITAEPDMQLEKSRLRNQADFYSLFGALIAIPSGELETPQVLANRIAKFLERVAAKEPGAPEHYYEAARSASNDAGPRAARIAIMADVLRA